MKQLPPIFFYVALIFPLSHASAADVSVFQDVLTPEWQNWSWSSTVNFANVSPVHSGTRSMSIKYNGAWAALYLHATAAYSTTEYNQIRFWIHGGSAGDQKIALVANGDTNHHHLVTAPANAWTEVTVPFTHLGNPATVSDLYWQDATGTAQPLFYLDDVQLLASNAPPPPPPTLSIDAGVVRHAISENIYGMNFAEESLASELRLPVRRWGGNSTTRYNWKTSMTNTASDWYYENLPEGIVNVANLPNGSASDQFVEQNRRTGTRSILTVPLIGWTAKGSSPRNHPYDCAFKVSRYGSQQAVDPWDSDCGNGIKKDGSLLTGNDPRDTSDPIDAAFVKGWIQHLVGRYGTGANLGVEFYNLDNEPMLWSSTHRDIHPQPVSYDELRDRTLMYAAAIKDADPTAKTLGPVLWGWCAYLYSAKDGCSPGADYLGHGSQHFIPWYLSQMRSHEQSTSRRILDYLDLHYYPQASGVSLAPAGSAATQSLRLRSTRSLWDPSYIDESWISDTEAGGVKVNLISRMREWVNTYYPGTRLALTEYNFGGLEDINGALAQADVLGIFGRENLDLATLWSPPASGEPGAFAFRMYRNYDAKGNGFGNQNVAAVSSNQDALAVYAAKRSKDNALTVMVINKTSGALTSPLNIAGASLPATAAVYRYSKTNLGAIVKLPDQTMTSTGFSAEFPANSITLFVASQSKANQAALTVTSTPGILISGGSGSKLTTTGGSTGGAVTFSVVSSSGPICNIAGNTLSATGSAGTCSVTATMAGDANYLPVTSAPLAVPVQANVAPVAVNDSLTLLVTGTTPVTIAAPGILSNDTDANRDGLTVVGATATTPRTITLANSGGRVTLQQNGGFTYTPPSASFSGTRSFTYQATDGKLTSNTATVTLAIARRPTATADTTATALNTAKVISVLANDRATPPATLNPASVVITSAPANGSAQANANGTVTYTPTTGFTGTNTFTYTVRDSLGSTSNPAIVTVHVPQARNDSYSVTANTSTSQTVNAASVALNDVPNISGRTFTRLTNPIRTSGTGTGTLTITSFNTGTGAFSYRLSGTQVNKRGTFQFSYRMSLGGVNTAAATVTIGVR